MHKIERELVKVTKVEGQGEDEDRFDFLERLVQAVNVLEEGEWEELSEGAKNWANNATRALKAGKKLPDFEAGNSKEAKRAAPAKAKAKAKPAEEDDDEDEDDEGEEAEEADADDDPEDDEDEKKAPPKKAAKPAAKDKDKDKPRGMSAVAFVRHYVGSHPQAEVSEIEEAVAKAGYTTLTKSSIGTIRSDFRSIAKVIKELGFLKKGVDLGV